MKVELTKEEAQGLLATIWAIRASQLETQTVVQQHNAFVQQKSAEQLQLAEGVCSRVGVEWVSPDKWDLSGIDRKTYAGSVEIPTKKIEAPAAAPGAEPAEGPAA